MALLSPFEKIPLQTTANLREDYHVKRDVSHRLVENKEHMKQLALSVLRRLQKLPILIMSFFRQPECRYILE